MIVNFAQDPTARLYRSGVELFSQVEGNCNPRCDPLSLQKLPSLFRHEAEANVALDPCRLQCVACNELLQFVLREIAVYFPSRDKAKFVVADRADAGAHQFGILKEIWDLTKMRLKRQGLGPPGEARPQLLKALK